MIDVDNIDDYTSIFIFNGQEIVVIDDNEENEIEDGRVEEFAGSLSPPLLQHFGTIQTIENKTKSFHRRLKDLYTGSTINASIIHLSVNSISGGYQVLTSSTDGVVKKVFELNHRVFGLIRKTTPVICSKEY